MKRIIHLLIILLPITTLCAQNETDFCDQLIALDRLIKKEHYSPKPVNDSLSVDVHELFISLIDPNKRYLTQDDIALFKDDALKLDDYIMSSDCQFINKYSSILRDRITKTIEIVQSLETEQLDYSGKEVLNFSDKENFNYFQSEQKIKTYWSKRISYDVIIEMMENDSIIDTIEKNFKTLEAPLKSKIIAKELCQLEEALGRDKDIETRVKEAFLNALANYQDPNTMFFNPTDKYLFESSVTNNQESFGLYTSKNDNGDIIISYIVSGGPAHKQGGFEVNDIVKLVSSGDDSLEAYCISNDQLQSFTSDEKHHTVVFKLKKKNGSLTEIELTKEKTRIEENIVRGYVVGDTERLGYINIPSFYADTESPNGLGLANDVAKELYRLDKEDIKGLIIDLRLNGGGSMKEASDLSGMFIDRGPLSILKYKNGETFTIKDTNRGSLFKKPMIILVDNFSASASEYFTSIMQDYNRAIVIGSPTHGKSTAQMVLPLSETENLGFGKVTVEKFYRVTGKSVQSKGVIPDIILPNFYDNFKTEELYMDYAFENDTIPLTLVHRTLKPLKLDGIISKSQQRINANTGFKAVKALNNLVINDYINKNTKYPLTLRNIYNDLNASKKRWENYSDILENKTTSLVVRNLKSTEELLQYNEADKEANLLVLKDIKNDIYIEEAYRILQDFITQNSSH